MAHLLRARTTAERGARRRLALGLLFISPWLIGFLAFTLYPLLSSLFYSFTLYDVVRPPRWIGPANYQDLLDDRLFRVALSNTGLYVFLAVPSSLVVAYLLAALLSRPLYGRAVLRTAFYVPAVVPAVSSALLWLWILDGRAGLVNGGLNSLGLPSLPWLAHPDWALPSLVLINLWFTGNAMVVFLAAIQDVPRELYAAAQVDGASPFQQLVAITVPLTTPAILFNLVTGLIGASQLFTFPYILTDGGPPTRPSRWRSTSTASPSATCVWATPVRWPGSSSCSLSASPS